MNDIVVPNQRPEAPAALERAQALVIFTNEEFVEADQFQSVLQALEKTIVSDFERPKKMAWDTHKAVVAQESAHLKPVQEARRILKLKMSAYQDDQERLRRQIEAEEQAKKQKEAEDLALAEAAALEKSGDKETAEQIISQPVIAPPVIVPKLTPKTMTMIRKIKKFRVVDPSKTKREFLCLDSVKIGQIVRASGKDAEHIVGGIQVYEEAA